MDTHKFDLHIGDSEVTKKMIYKEGPTMASVLVNSCWRGRLRGGKGRAVDGREGENIGEAKTRRSFPVTVRSPHSVMRGMRVRGVMSVKGEGGSLVRELIVVHRVVVRGGDGVQGVLVVRGVMEKRVCSCGATGIMQELWIEHCGSTCHTETAATSRGIGVERVRALSCGVWEVCRVWKCTGSSERWTRAGSIVVRRIRIVGTSHRKPTC